MTNNNNNNNHKNVTAFNCMNLGSKKKNPINIYGDFLLGDIFVRSLQG